MNYDELVTAYETDVRFPEVSGMEHLDMLMTRSEIASIEPHLSAALRERVLQADKQLMSRARQFYDAIQAIADLASWRRSEFTPITHWWWYLDVLAHLPVSLDTKTLRAAFQLIHDADAEDVYSVDSDQALDV
ncbi:MAG TPA: hypothetical protein PKZ84_03145 [Anaerolineae bacterium]|nr:hypothetical protein [Anaerolineae bacterium]HQI84887.1 hypothetical protein [Anaerolineae bacterium]